jgi:hypothetical protein
MQKRIISVKEKIIISVISVCCTVTGSYILSETIFLTDDVKIARIERKLDEIETNRKSTRETRFKDFYTQLMEKRRAGLITDSQLDESSQDFNIKESRYISDLAEEMADQANISSGAKFSFLMNRASKTIEEAMKEIKSRR